MTGPGARPNANDGDLDTSGPGFALTLHEGTLAIPTRGLRDTALPMGRAARRYHRSRYGRAGDRGGPTDAVRCGGRADRRSFGG